MKTLSIIFGLLFFQQLFSQDITGIWRGGFNERVLKGNKTLKNESDQKYNFEVQINQNGDNQLEGVTYSYKTKKYYGKASFKGSFDLNLKRVYIVEQNMLDVQVDEKSDICTMSCILNYSSENGKSYLKGTFISKNKNRKIECSSGDILLEKVNKSEFKNESFKVGKKAVLSAKKKEATNDSDSTIKVSKIIQFVSNTKNDKPVNIESLQKEDNNLLKPNSSLTEIIPDERLKRNNNLLNIITVNVNEILIEYYDNGIIDNDTITVFQNRNLVINKGRVSEKPLVLKLNIDSSNNIQEIITIADNLGDIPPNTSLMVVSVGKNRYEIPISTDDKRNAKVLFEYKKNENPKISIIRTKN